MRKGARDKILRLWAVALRERVSRSTMRYLAALPAELSGPDTGLKSIWDEVCAQVQHEKSELWPEYETVIHQSIERALSRCTQLELASMWLQTDQGWPWLAELTLNEDMPVATDDVRAWVYNEVESLALRDRRRAIVRFLRREAEVEG